MDELDTIEAKIITILDELEDIHFSYVDQVKRIMIRTQIIEVLESTTSYLNKTYKPMTSWQKKKILRTIQALYGDWLYIAINSIILAIADPATLSSEIKYEKKIIELTYEDLSEQISIVKNFFNKS